MPYTYFDYLQDCIKRNVLTQDEAFSLWSFDKDIRGASLVFNANSDIING